MRKYLVLETVPCLRLAVSGFVPEHGVEVGGCNSARRVKHKLGEDALLGTPEK